ncbi:DUF5798 family protein [Haloferax larsenii]|uniref:Uncharacterized protein n=1 Tax=Haloferax larsenii TaxID=302484 RepID=A0A1H7J9W2_HALLR|nr:DUF5798 family protein [Haloferax larsenii]ELZ82268.1 hypothetical protein C455_03634 [Haloferax larsenii JCM 13917]UVE49674.1 hypothetical protein KU306_12245 [Haloferax larsenii]SEK71144.1 hypothetical protein SAMN04488691_1011135 [Haloferax larsenii]
MALGGTAKKLQKVAEMAEDVYKKLNELREQIVEVRETVTETKDRVDRLEAENAEQRAILEAIAEEQGIDLDAVIADAHITEAEAPADDSATDTTDEAADADQSE